MRGDLRVRRVSRGDHGREDPPLGQHNPSCKRCHIPGIFRSDGLGTSIDHESVLLFNPEERIRSGTYREPNRYVGIGGGAGTTAILLITSRFDDDGVLKCSYRSH